MRRVRHGGVRGSAQDGADAVAAPLCAGVMGRGDTQRPEGEYPNI